MQARARIERYDALLGWTAAVGADWLATAHHADDQLETMIMRLNRGSGVAGLASVRERADTVVRPLLGWRRGELAAVVAACGVTAIVDPSNDDQRFDRARLRRHLRDIEWIDPIAVVGAARALGDADAALDYHARAALKDFVALGPQSAMFGLPKLFDLPRETQRRVVLKIIEHIDPAIKPRESALQNILDAMRDGINAMIGDWVFKTVDGVGMVLRATPRNAITPPAAP